MGSKAALVVPSGSCLGSLGPPDVVVVPVQVVIGQRSLRDGIDITPEELFAALDREPAAPTTSTPSPGEYLEAIRRAAGAERDVLVLTPDSDLTGMHASALVAARLYQEEGGQCRVEVIDTRTAAGGLGMVVRVAAACCQAGLSVDEVARRLRRSLPEVRMIGSLSTLSHLARSGRVPSIATGAADLFGVHPIFELHDGRIRRLGLAIGEDGTLRGLVRHARRRFRGPVWLVTFHTAEPDLAKQLHRRLEEALGPERSELCRLEPSIGAHTGPGLVGFAAVPRPEGIPTN